MLRYRRLLRLSVRQLRHQPEDNSEEHPFLTKRQILFDQLGQKNPTVEEHKKGSGLRKFIEKANVQKGNLKEGIAAKYGIEIYPNRESFAFILRSRMIYLSAFDNCTVYFWFLVFLI